MATKQTKLNNLQNILTNLSESELDILIAQAKKKKEKMEKDGERELDKKVSEAHANIALLDKEVVEKLGEIAKIIDSIPSTRYISYNFTFDDTVLARYNNSDRNWVSSSY